MENKTEVLAIKNRISKQSKFDKRVIKKIVGLIESGMLQKDAALEYGVNPDTIIRWLDKYASASYQATRRKVFSRSQKRTVVRAVHNGMSVTEAQRSFNISYPSVIRKWLTEFNEENSEISDLKITMMSKKPKQTSSAEVQALKKALDEANFKIKALDTLIDIAEEKLHIDIRKKSGARQSPR
jgi:transposase